MGLLGGSTTTTTKSDPWAPQGDALKSIFNSAGALYVLEKKRISRWGPAEGLGVDITD